MLPVANRLECWRNGGSLANLRTDSTLPRMVFESVRALVRSAKLDLDEGGIRAERGEERTYWPFEALRDAKLVKVSFTTVSLLVQLATGSWRRLALGHHSPSVALATVQSGI